MVAPLTLRVSANASTCKGGVGRSAATTPELLKLTFDQPAMAKQYFYRRYIRNPIPKRYQPQPRDNRILERLDQYSRLDTYQLLALLRPFGLRNLRRRLQYLFHDGLVGRQRHDPDPIVYSLTNKGREQLAKDKLPPKKKAGREYIDHTLMISRFRATLDLALQPQGKTHLIAWQKESADLKAVIKTKGQRLVIKPDGFFTIQHRGKPLHFFLEADRSTMTNQRYLAKLRAYWLWWEKGGHQRTFNIPNFRVLTLTISEKRKENLRALARQADDKKRGSTMFSFTCEKSFRLEDPETILKSVWQTPVDDARHPLLP